jgi:hypothetical protein
MQLALGLFLIVATGVVIAQQYSAGRIPPVVSEAVPLPSSEPSTPEITTSASTGPAVLPDAPSYTTQNPSIQSSTSPASRTVTGMTNDRSFTSFSISKRYLNSATLNSFGNSQVTFVGGASTVTASQPSGMVGNDSGQNCLHGSAEKANGGGWITSLVSLTSKGGHYCALGEGGFWKRGTYAATRAIASHRFDGTNLFNVSDIFAPGTGYYPYQNYAGDRLAARYASAVGRDALRNMFREFWPDIASHMLHRHP